MSRINTNVNSLLAQRTLGRNNKDLSTSLERLSTGLKINSGRDNPAGLIASENLRAEKTGITQAIDNAERASNLIGTAEGGLSEVSSLLNELSGLVGQSANKGGLSSEEVAANQLQVDSILNTVNRIANTTQFQGTKLLNGNYDYTTSSVTASAFTSLRVNAARVPDGTKVNVVVTVTNSATTGQVSYAGGTTTDAVTIEVAGNSGSEQLSFATGATNADIVSAVNALKDQTGVSATISGGNVEFASTGYGSSQYVSVKTIGGTFATTDEDGNNDGKDYGRNATVSINGTSAETDGLTVRLRNSNLDVEFDISTGLNGGNSKTFAITGGGAQFALGSKVNETTKASIGLASVTTSSLGKGTLGFLSSLGSGGANAVTGNNLVKAQKIVDEAVKQVSQARGRLGAFQRFTVGSTVNNLGVAFENISAAESSIRDTDFAAETAKLTRAQILSQAATTVLSQANSAPQQALQLLR